jgi:hypothetical protein
MARHIGEAEPKRKRETGSTDALNDILRLNRSIAVFLGLATSSRTSRWSRGRPEALN